MTMMKAVILSLMKPILNLIQPFSKQMKILMNFKSSAKVYKVISFLHLSNSLSPIYPLELQLDTTGYNQALLATLTPEQHTQIQNIIHYTEKRKQEKGRSDSNESCR